MTDDRAVRMALELAALVAAVRRYVTAEEHLVRCRCYLCEALAEVDRRSPTYDPAPFGDPELAPYWNREVVDRRPPPTRAP